MRTIKFEKPKDIKIFQRKNGVIQYQEYLGTAFDVEKIRYERCLHWLRIEINKVSLWLNSPAKIVFKDVQQ